MDDIRKIEHKLDEVYDKVFKNGLSADLKSVMKWQKNVNKLLWAILITVTLSLVKGFIGDKNEELKSIKQELRKLSNANPKN